MIVCCLLVFIQHRLDTQDYVYASLKSKMLARTNLKTSSVSVLYSIEQ